MSMLNFHDGECAAYSTAIGCEQAACTCKPLPPMPPLTPREGPVDVADKNTKLTDVVVDLPIDIDGPVFVYDSNGKPLGSAVLSFVHGGMQARLFLNAHNPVSFDLVNEPTRCVFKLHARICDGVLDKATVALDSK